jgi:hypothetical protein
MAPHDDQRGAARIATISALIVVSSFVAGKAARDAILLAHFDVKTLPIFMAISALMSLPIILVAGRLMTRYGPARLVPAINLASALLSGVEWLLLHRYPGPVAALVFFHLATSGAVLTSGFWSIVNERFDVQTAKRHIGRIGMGATLGGILGGVLAERTAAYMRPDKILLVLAALQLTCAVTLYLFGASNARPQVPSKPAGTWAAFRVVTRSQLLRNVAAIVVLGAVAAGVMDYVFKADIVQMSSKAGLLRSLAIFYTVTNVITAIVQIAVCAPLIARLGVPRGVATLPITITVFGVFALAIPVPLAAAIARGAELVTRNSVYRAGYELLYAPLAEDDKRPTKVVLDVGADRIGDLFGAQLVALILYASAEPRTGLLVATLVTAVIAVIVAMRLPRSYTMALEDSLLARAPDPAAAASAEAEPEPWFTLNGLPRLGQAGDIAPLSMRIREASLHKRAGRKRAKTPPAAIARVPPPLSGEHDNLLDAIADLRSEDPARIKRVLAIKLTPELAAYAIGLLGRDEVAAEAIAALSAVAPRCTGLLVDALLDQDRPTTVRRRLPAVLLHGRPSLAAWGLWRALLDPSFDVRYRSGAVLARLAAAGHLENVVPEEVFGLVKRELLADRHALRNQCELDDLATPAEARPDEPAVQRLGNGLEHIFTVLGLALPAEPLRIALHAVQTDDAELRGTALEYLESILPADVRAQLWPFLEGESHAQRLAARAHDAADASTAHDAADSATGLDASDSASALATMPAAAQAVSLTPPRAGRSRDEMVAALRLSYPSIVEKLRGRPKPA